MKLYSATDCLAEAERADRIARDCGPLDPAFRLFTAETDAWLSEAARRELEELNASPPKSPTLAIFK